MDYSQFATVIQDAPKATVSNKYSFIPTKRVISQIVKLGWTVKSIRESRTINKANEGFQRHLVTFQPNAELLKSFPVVSTEGLTPEINLYNGHDGACSFKIMSGLFRWACENSLYSAEALFGTHTIKHIGYKDDQVIDAVFNVVDRVPEVMGKITEWSGNILTLPEKIDFAREAAKLRWQDADRQPDPRQLLWIRRMADRQDDLFTTYNIIQENMLKSGINIPNKPEITESYDYGLMDTVWTKRSKGFRRSKAITGIKETVTLNQSLWTLTDKISRSR